MGKNQNGQVVVELAIVLPFFFFLLFAVLEIGLMYNAKQITDLGAFRAARSFLALKEPQAAQKSFSQTLKGVTFRSESAPRCHVEIVEKPDAVIARAVYLYKPVFPVTPLARFLGYTLLWSKNSDLIRRAIAAHPDWAEKIKTHVAVSAAVSLNR